MDDLKAPRLNRRLRIALQVPAERIQLRLNGRKLTDEQDLHIRKTRRRLNRSNDNLFGGVVASHCIKGNSSHRGNPLQMELFSRGDNLATLVRPALGARTVRTDRRSAGGADAGRGENRLLKLGNTLTLAHF
jgi:hypothetical protein